MKMEYNIEDVKLKKEIDESVCRLIIHETPCNVQAKARGLCSSHYNYLHKRNLLDKFSPKKKFLLKNFKSNFNQSHCATIAEGTQCYNRKFSHGLCVVHYTLFDKHDCVDRFGRRTYKKFNVDDFKVKKVQGNLCKIIRGGIGCKTESDKKGLCKYHYNALWDHDALEGFV